jgi:hypothetical protein
MTQLERQVGKITTATPVLTPAARRASRFADVASALSGSAAAGLAVAAIVPELPVLVPLAASFIGFLGISALWKRL